MSGEWQKLETGPPELRERVDQVQWLPGQYAAKVISAPMPVYPLRRTDLYVVWRVQHSPREGRRRTDYFCKLEPPE